MRAYYGGWTRCESVPFNVAIGVRDEPRRWLQTSAELGPGPVLSYSPDEPFVLSGPKIRRFAGQLATLVHRRPKVEAGARPARARLQDPHGHFRTTASTGPSYDRDLIRSRIEEDEAQASPDVFHANGKYHMFFCYRYSSDFRGQAARLPHRLRIQHELVDWDRDDAKAGIDVSADGWDAEMVSYPARVRAGRTRLHGLPRQPGRPARLRAGRARRRTVLSERRHDEVAQARAGSSTRREHQLPNDCVQFAQSPQALVFDDFVRDLLLHPRRRHAATAST